MRRIGFRLSSPPMVLAFVELLVALAGTSYAAIQLPAGSVGTKQLKRNAVTGKKVKNRSLNAADFATGQLPAGPQGPQGLQGPKGDKGAPAPTPIITARVSDPAPTDAEVLCEPGAAALGGGGTPAEGGYLTDSGPSNFVEGTPTAWIASAAKSDGGTVNVVAWVVCGRPGA